MTLICVSPEQIRTLLLGVGWWDWSVYICFVAENLSVFPPRPSTPLNCFRGGYGGYG